MFEIVGKVCLITGGAGVIGSSIVLEMLEKGIRGIAIIDRSEESGRALIHKINEKYDKDRAFFLNVDITKSEEFEGAFDTTISIFNNLDIVINAAGIMDEFNWERTVAINLEATIKGTYLAKDKYIPKYKSTEEGLVINLASVIGLRVSHSTPIYTTTKYGIVALGVSLGCEEHYEITKTRIITICPGAVKSPLLRNHDKTVILHNLSKKELPTFIERVQTPDYVAETVTYAITEGKNGAVIVTEDCKPCYEYKLQYYKNQ